jgi:methylthioribulose-1-phosphate dehydratase
MSTELQRRAEALMAVGRLLYAMGMVPATSGNFAARPADDNLAITVSGRHKGRLTQEDIMLADAVHRLKQQPKKSGNALTPPLDA